MFSSQLQCCNWVGAVSGDPHLHLLLLVYINLCLPYKTWACLTMSLTLQDLAEKTITSLTRFWELAGRETTEKCDFPLQFLLKSLNLYISKVKWLSVSFPLFHMLSVALTEFLLHTKLRALNQM